MSVFIKKMLFYGMNEAELSQASKKLSAEEKEYRKGVIILHAGNRTERMGMVLSESVTIENNDTWGNRTILSYVGKGQFFCGNLCMARTAMHVDVVANDRPHKTMPSIFLEGIGKPVLFC